MMIEDSFNKSFHVAHKKIGKAIQPTLYWSRGDSIPVKNLGFVAPALNIDCGLPKSANRLDRVVEAVKSYPLVIEESNLIMELADSGWVVDPFGDAALVIRSKTGGP